VENHTHQGSLVHYYYFGPLRGPCSICKHESEYELGAANMYEWVADATIRWLRCLFGIEFVSYS